MKALPVTPELLRVVHRVVWFEEPERTLANPIQFLAHVMVYGTIEDLRALCGIVGKDEFCEVPDEAPPGISTRGRGLTGTWFAVVARCPLPMRTGLRSG